jgi:hypothetical protein
VVPAAGAAVASAVAAGVVCCVVALDVVEVQPAVRRQIPNTTRSAIEIVSGESILIIMPSSRPD